MSEIFEEYYNIDSHSILRNVSVELIIEYLREQFTDPYNLSTRNYVDEFIGDYEYTKNALVSDNENNVVPNPDKASIKDCIPIGVSFPFNKILIL